MVVEFMGLFADELEFPLRFIFYMKWVAENLKESLSLLVTVNGTN